MENTIKDAKKDGKNNFVLILIIYLAGIFMGAIDTGIVTPARTVIQNGFGVDATSGIWMITIYTLAYAASIPVMGKLADRYGRKYVYISCVSLFALGSLLCGLSQHMGGFPMLIVSRAIQAIGGGGIMPVATAEFGTTFPKEKRGMALGLVGAVYGIANIFGASAGSLILDIFGSNNWQYIFYVNIPISLFIIIAGLLNLKNTRVENKEKIDILGIFTIVIMVLSLLYGLKNLDFFQVFETLVNENVYPFLILFLILLPIFVLIEKKAHDPVMNLGYFKNINILTTLIISFFSGFIMMGVVFVPQFAENALKMATGSGGYLVIILGTFAGVGAPTSGRLIDKFGVKKVLGLGFGISILGALFIIFITTVNPNIVTIVFALALMGTGMGFTMGTPLNYMMLENTHESESNSALATLSLVRSIGTAIAPAIMVGFLAHSGVNIQGKIIDILPKEIIVPQVTYAQEITDKINDFKNMDGIKDKKVFDSIPDLTANEKVEINMSGEGSLPSDLVELLQNSDVTNIKDNAKIVSARMFDDMTPEVISDIQGGFNKGIKGIKTGIKDLEKNVRGLKEGKSGVGEAVKGMKKGILGQKEALVQLENVRKLMNTSRPAPNMTIPNKMPTDSMMPNPTKMPTDSMMPNPTKMPTDSMMPNPTKMPTNAMGGNPSDKTVKFQSIADMIPPAVKGNIPEAALKELKKIKNLKELDLKIENLKISIKNLEAKVKVMEEKIKKMDKAIGKMENTLSELKDLKNKMIISKNDVPGIFTTAKENYLTEIDNKSDEIEAAYQSTLNLGFKDVYRTTAIASVLGLLLLLNYSRKRIKV